MWVVVSREAPGWRCLNSLQGRSHIASFQINSHCPQQGCCVLFAGQKKADQCVHVRSLGFQQSSFCTAWGSPTWSPQCRECEGNIPPGRSPKALGGANVPSLVSRHFVPTFISVLLLVHYEWVCASNFLTTLWSCLLLFIALVLDPRHAQSRCLIMNE